MEKSNETKKTYIPINGLLPIMVFAGMFGQKECEGFVSIWYLAFGGLAALSYLIIIPALIVEMPTWQKDERLARKISFDYPSTLSCILAIIAGWWWVAAGAFMLVMAHFISKIWRAQYEKAFGKIE